jgi:hypothetical protein
MNKNTIITALIIGLIAGIAFILIQPLFGMATLTSRHADAYINMGAYSEIFALVLSWLVHISVSVIYALVSSVIFNYNHSMLVSFVQVMVLGWITTLIATPANQWLIKLITSGEFLSLSSLSGLNTQVGPKLWLHIMFFVFILVGLYSTRSRYFIENQAIN